MYISPTTLNYNIMVDLKRTSDLNFDAMPDCTKGVNQDQLKTAHHIDVSNKVHADALASDPYWINGVHCHDSISRHNYSYQIAYWNL
jgi:hypothetical protein